MAVGDISSLPKWAQKEYYRMKMQRDAAQEKVNLLQSELGETRVQLGMDGIYLPDTRSIYFRTGEDDHERIYVKLTVDKELEVTASAHGQMVMVPVVSNSVRFKILPR